MIPLNDNIGKAIMPAVSAVSTHTPDDTAVTPLETRMSPPGVTARDIIAAENFGVMVGLQRHLDCEPKVKVKAALDIMETIFKSGFAAKVSAFVRSYGAHMLNELDDPALKADFAIRVARMMDPEHEQGAWCEAAMVLLKDETVRDQCDKKALEMLAMIWANVGNHEQTIHWLAAAKADRDQYKEATLKFFLEGAFENGLTILDQAPENPCNPEDFVELIAYGLRHKEIYEDDDYRKKILQFQDDWKYRDIILLALCHFSLKEQALKLSKEMALHCNRIYPMLGLSKYFTEVDERRVYIDTLCSMGQLFDEKKGEESKGYGVLFDLVKRQEITINEAISISHLIPTPAPRVSALWERACGISNKRDKGGYDLNQLQVVLKTIVRYLAQTVSTDYLQEYWEKVLECQVEYGFLEDALAVEESWQEWRKICGECECKCLNQRRQIGVLCYFALLKYFNGNIQEAVANLKDAIVIMEIILIENPKIPDDLNDHMSYITKKFQSLELTLSNKLVLKALACNPRSCEEIFKYEKDWTVVSSLVGSCFTLIKNIRLITDLTSEPWLRRAKQSLQYRKLAQKMIAGLGKIQENTADSVKALESYRKIFTEKEEVVLIEKLDLIFQTIQENRDEKWSLGKIRKLILPLEQGLSTLHEKLIHQRNSLYNKLSDFG